MINNKRIIAIVPARSGSKGLPRKNVYPLAGRPLIAWTLEAAKKSKYIDRLIVSTDDSEIMEAAKAHGVEVPFRRPPELSGDSTPGIEAILHALSAVGQGYDYVVLLQPTSPLRLAEDIDACIELCYESGAPSVVSITEADKNPYWMYRMTEERRLEPLFPEESRIANRQELPKAYHENGAVYVAECEWLNRTRSLETEETLGYIMPRERSIDIDIKMDILVAEKILSTKG